MAINKNAITRYRALDDCFRNFGKQFFIEDLIEACNKKLKSFDEKSSGVKLRQVLYDIDYMESATAFKTIIIPQNFCEKFAPFTMRINCIFKLMNYFFV